MKEFVESRGGGFRGRGDTRGGGRGRGDTRGGGRGGFRGGGRGGGRGGFGGGGMRGAVKTMVVPHRFAGIFIAKGQQEALVTKNLVPGESVYNEKRISIDDRNTGEKIEYRVWNPYRSKIAAAILGGVSDIYIRPGVKVLYLGAASGTTVSHVSDIVGQDGVVYAVEFSHRSGRDLVNLAKKRTNIVPLIFDARKPLEYRFLVGMVDVVFADVAQPDQARIVGLNSQFFLKKGGHFVISIKANCIDSTNIPEVVFQHEVERLKVIYSVLYLLSQKEEGLTPEEQLTLEPYERDHAVVTGTYNQ